MRKQILTLIGFLLLSSLVFVQGRQLTLTFFILFPVLIFPLFYFFDWQNKSLLGLSIVVVLIVYFAYVLREQSVEVVSFGLGCGSFPAVPCAGTPGRGTPLHRHSRSSQRRCAFRRRHSGGDARTRYRQALRLSNPTRGNRPRVMPLRARGGSTSCRA